MEKYFVVRYQSGTCIPEKIGRVHTNMDNVYEKISKLSGWEKSEVKDLTDGAVVVGKNDKIMYGFLSIPYYNRRMGIN